jgi:transposase
MMGSKERAFGPLCQRSLETLVPTDHFYRHLDAKLDLGFVRDLVHDKYAAAGRPSIDPIVFFKLQLVMFFEGLRSERELVRVAADRLSVRWYLGYDLDEELPDHSSLTKIRARYGLAIFARFFERIVELCQQAGLVWGRELIVDATKVRANAALDTVVPRFYWQWKTQQHLAALFSEANSEPGPELTTPPPPDPPEPAPLRLPAGLSAEDEVQLAAEQAAHWKLLEQHRLDPERPSVPGYQRLSDRRVSPTDPDAALMLDGRGPALGYQDHYVVDGGRARIILAALVTPADVREQTPLQDLVWRVRFRWKLRPKRVIGDTAYGTVDNIRVLEDAGIRAYMPLSDVGRRAGFFGAEAFTYDAERDLYTCPQGAELRFRGIHRQARVRAYQARAVACNGCPLRARCTDSRQGRILTRSFDEAYLERVRAYHQTAAYQKAMRKRQVWVEPLFGEAKDWHDLRRFRLRGLDRVNIQGLLVATGQNLKRLLQQWGWGRRPWPVGSAASGASHGALPPLWSGSWLPPSLA